jgi:hypothetical protein
MNCHNIRALYAAAEDGLVVVDEGDVVLFGGKLLCQTGTNFAVACNYDIHKLPPMQDILFSIAFPVEFYKRAEKLSNPKNFSDWGDFLKIFIEKRVVLRYNIHVF